MSKAPDSPLRSRSRSRSRSYSRSRSRSRSRKHRYSSRSRSRSRSHSPSHSRNYPTRDYHNNRGGFRGYNNRGFRRPFYNRGFRTRGYYPRGRYPRGGGYNNNYNNNRPNSWQGGGSYQHHDQEHHPHSPRRGRSRSRTPKKRSDSRSHSRSRYSDRSSSGRSRRSRHSSYSSRSSSPRRRSSSGKQGSKEGKEAAGDAPRERSGSGGGGGGGAGDAAALEKASAGKWKGLSDYDASPKSSRPAAGPSQAPPTGSEGKSPSGAGAALWKTVGGGSAPPTKSPPASTASFGGFGFFSKEDTKTVGDKTAISSAFKKFLAENKGKKQASERENGAEQTSTDKDKEKTTGKTGLYSISSSIAAFGDAKEDKSTPFFDKAEELFFKSQDRESVGGDEDKPKPALTARDIFGKWEDDSHYYGKDKNRREADEVEADLEHMEEELYRSRKQSSKKEEKAKKKEKKEKEKSRRSPSPPTASHRASDSREKDRPLFPCAREESPVKRLSGKREDFELKVKSLDEMPSSSGAQREHRQSQDALHPAKKEQEFRSIFQHLQQAHLRRSPSELFAQHIVTIVHYIKAQHFRSSGMTLSERFATYQRKAAEMEKMKPRKSPEIHRRIDLSPSAFKKRHLFDDVDEPSYKDQGSKVKGDVMDLRLDIERRKRFAAKEQKRELGRASGGSRGPSLERSEKSAKHHKKSKKSKKRRERSPSSSSSSSSPSPSYRGKEYLAEGMEHMEEGYKPRFGPRDYPPGPRDHEGHMDRGPRDYEGPPMDRGRGRGFFPRVRGRGWSRGNYPGNSSNGNPPSMNAPVRPPEEEWDPEYTPKSRKYYLHDDREGEKSWADGRGRGRGTFPRSRGGGAFVYRKGGSSPKWTHDMFQGAEEGELGEDSGDMDHKDDKPGDAPDNKQ